MIKSTTATGQHKQPNMKGPQTPPAQKKNLPIHWLKPTAFKIPIRRDERQRLATLYRYDILDTPPEKTFDSIAVIVAHICQTPIALLVLINQNRQWFKASVGVRLKETPREFAFCAHTIMQRSLFVIPDATQDKAVRGKPFGCVRSPVSFLCRRAACDAGQSSLGGTLCVIDKARRTLTAAQRTDLLALSRLVITEIELRRSLRAERRVKTPFPSRRPQPYATDTSFGNNSPPPNAENERSK